MVVIVAVVGVCLGINNDVMPAPVASTIAQQTCIFKELHQHPVVKEDFRGAAFLLILLLALLLVCIYTLNDRSLQTSTFEDHPRQSTNTNQHHNTIGSPNKKKKQTNVPPRSPPSPRPNNLGRNSQIPIRPSRLPLHPRPTSPYHHRLRP